MVVEREAASGLQVAQRMMMPHLQKTLAMGFAVDIAAKEDARLLLFPGNRILDPEEMTHLVHIEQDVVVRLFGRQDGTAFGESRLRQRMTDVAAEHHPLQALGEKAGVLHAVVKVCAVDFARHLAVFLLHREARKGISPVGQRDGRLQMTVEVHPVEDVAPLLLAAFRQSTQTIAQLHQAERIGQKLPPQPLEIKHQMAVLVDVSPYDMEEPHGRAIPYCYRCGCGSY